MESNNMQSMGDSATLGKRFAVAIIDLIICPILIGVVAGFALIAAPEKLRTAVLIVVNIGWLLVRDTVFSPGRKMVGLKLVSLTGEKVTIVQAFIRNLLLMFPFILVAGYVIEIIAIIVKKDRLADGWAKTKVVNA